MKILNSPETPPEVLKAITKKARVTTRIANTKAGAEYAKLVGLQTGDELVVMKAHVSNFYGGGYLHQCCRADGTGVLFHDRWYHTFWLCDDALTDPPLKKKTTALRQVKQGA